MKLVSELILISCINIEAEKCISSSSFPVSQRKFAPSENNVSLDNKIRVLIKNNKRLQSGTSRISKNPISCYFSALIPRLMSGWFVIMENNLEVNART